MLIVVVLGGAALVLLIGLALLVYFADKLAYQRGLKKLAEREAVAIAEAPDGQPVRVTGTVKLLEPLTAPVTERPCAAWHVKVGVLRRNEHGAWMANPFEMGEKRRSARFVIDDGSGAATVEAEDAELLIVVEPVEHRGKEQADAIRARLEAGRGVVREVTGEGVFKFQEGRLDEGERVTVMGVASWSTGADGRRQLTIRGAKGELLRVSDDPSVAA